MRHILSLLLLIALTASVVQAEKHPVLRLATTTSTENSGLLEYLLPAFEQQSGYKIHVIAVGTGKALRMGRDGDVDVLLVHAPGAEARFVNQGYGIDRAAVMHNDFVIVGPESDPARLAQARSVTEALNKIMQKKSRFISRGDDSGTHKKELLLWQASQIKPQEKWYLEVGQGMGKVLQIASEMDAYTLTDRGTWLAYQDHSPLKLVFQGDQALHNPYSIIAVNPERYSDINYAGAKAMIRWITSRQTQQKIAAFKRHNQQLFTPDSLVNKVTTPRTHSPVYPVHAPQEPEAWNR